MSVTYVVGDYKVESITTAFSSPSISVQEGDYVIALLVKGFAPAGTASGWTLLGTLADGSMQVRAYGRFAPSTGSIQYVGATTSQAALRSLIVAYRGVGAVDSAISAINNNTTVSSPSVSVSAVSGMSVLLAINAGSGTPSLPGAVTTRLSGTSRVAGDEDVVSSGAVPTRDLTAPASMTGGFLAVALSVDNVAPNAPTLNSPTGGATIDRTVGQVFSWTFSDPDTGDSQSEYEVRARVATTSPWTVEVGAAVPTQSHTFAGGTFTAGNWEWQARTKDQAGEWGPWSASETFTAADPPGAPTITAPANDATISQLEQLVEWSAAAQEAYELRRVADAAGSPDTSDVLFTTGEVAASGARSRVLEFPTNSVTEHIQLRVRDDGLWSDWASIRNPVSYTPPATPTLAMTTNATAGTITVTPTFPTPSGGQPTVESYDVRVRVAAGSRLDGQRPVGGDGIRIDALRAPASPFVDRAAASGVTYEYRVVARGDNGTVSNSAWTA